MRTGTGVWAGGVGVLVGMLALVSSVSGADEDKAALVRALCEMRSATLPLLKSGRGSAQISGTYTGAVGRPVRTLIAHKVSFVFSGMDSIWREENSDKPGALMRATLNKGSQVASYFAGDATVSTKSVSIAKSAGVGSILAEPPNWSLQEMARVPVPLPDEGQFFALTSASRHARVEKDGEVIRMTITEPIEANDVSGRIFEERKLEFSLKQGGMLTGCWHTQRRKREGREEEIQQNVQMSWEAKGTEIVPTQRRVDLRLSINGKESQRVQSVVNFREVVLEPVGEKELTIEQLKIPVGTPVVDDIKGLEYKYGEPEVGAASVREMGKETAAVGGAGSVDMGVKAGPREQTEGVDSLASGDAGVGPGTMWALLTVLMAGIGVLYLVRRRQRRGA